MSNKHFFVSYLRARRIILTSTFTLVGLGFISKHYDSLAYEFLLPCGFTLILLQILFDSHYKPSYFSMTADSSTAVVAIFKPDLRYLIYFKSSFVQKDVLRNPVLTNLKTDVMLLGLLSKVNIEFRHQRDGHPYTARYYFITDNIRTHRR